MLWNTSLGRYCDVSRLDAPTHAALISLSLFSPYLSLSLYIYIFFFLPPPPCADLVAALAEIRLHPERSQQLGPLRDLQVGCAGPSEGSLSTTAVPRSFFVLLLLHFCFLSRKCRLTQTKHAGSLGDRMLLSACGGFVL